MNVSTLPPLRSREEMLEILLREEYGYLPPPPTDLTFTSAPGSIPRYCAGHAELSRITAQFSLLGKPFSFDFTLILPKTEGKHPFFINIGFEPDAPNNRYLPAEEIVDAGFAILYFCYRDITSDDGDFSTGLSGILYPDGKRNSPTDCGKLAMWAWAAQRVMDFAVSHPALDIEQSIVCGHSRLGKTSLLCAASDERFAYAFSSGAGCSGDAITRGKRGERILNIMHHFSYWFCENYGKWTNREDEMPFDQHYLLACCAPRGVYIASASWDTWADPEAQLLSCCFAGKAWKENGFPHDSALPACDRAHPAYLHGGKIGFHVRHGDHYFSRWDWNGFIKYYKER